MTTPISAISSLPVQTAKDALAAAEHAISGVRSPSFDRFIAVRKAGTPEPQMGREGGSSKASRLVGLYKVVGGVLLTGGSATLLFGTPFSIAIGLGVAFSAVQSLLALKICKGDTGWSQKLLNVSRKIMHEDHAEKPSGRAIAPVWAGVTALLGLVETGLNYIFRRKETAEQIRGVLAKKAATPSSFQWFYKLQQRGFLWKEAVAVRVKQSAWVRGASRNRLVLGLKKYKTPLVFAVAGLAGLVGGYLQALVAVKLEQRINHSSNPASK